MKTYRGIFLLASQLLLPSVLWALPPQPGPLDAGNFQFKYIEIEGTATGDCTHSSTNFVDWDVTCKVENRELKFNVHLVLNFYPKTNEGYPAYELLYWINQKMGTATTGDSVSQWTFLSSEESRIKILQTRLGIENDRAYLQLTVR